MTVVRRTYGKTWAKLEDKDFFTSQFMDQVGRLLLDSIVREIRKDLAKQGKKPTPEGKPEGIPVSERFIRSFTYKVVGTKVEISSTWPWVEQIIEGRPEYPMDWLTKEKGVDKVPMKSRTTGMVVIRSTPKSAKDAWIHPGFKKHNFVRRGFEKARKQMDKMLREQTAKVLNNTPPL